MIQTALTNITRSVNPALIRDSAKLALQLEQFRCFDFSSMQAELVSVFQLTHDRIKLRHVPLAHRVAVDGAGPYDLAPVREFGGSVQVAERFRTVYAELGVDEVLLEAEQAGVLQQAYLLGCWPDRKGRLQLRPFLPFEVVSVAFDDPTSARTDISEASEVILARSIARPTALGTISPWVSVIQLTPTEAWQILPDGQQIGLFTPDGSNPLGRVPLVGTRRARPAYSTKIQPVDWLPTHAQDVLSCQIGIILACSHIEYTARSQTHTKTIVAGEEAGDLPAEIEDRADGVMLLPAQVTATALKLDPPIEKYIRAVETTVYYLSQFRYLRPEAYAASIVTGAARRADQLGFEANQRRQETRCTKLEQQLKRLIAETYNATQRTALKLDPEATLSIRHRHVRAPENALQEQQARAVKISQLMSSVVEEIAHEDGMTEAEARRVALARLEDLGTFARAAGKTPGLDQVDDDTTTPAELTGENVQLQALNGAQMDSLRAIAESVIAGTMTSATAKELISMAVPGRDIEVEQLVRTLSARPPIPPAPQEDVDAFGQD